MVRDSIVDGSQSFKEGLTAYVQILKDCLEKKFESGNQYITGDKMSVIDVMVYCEISTIVKLYSEPISTNDLPLTSKWYDKLSQLEMLAN